MAAGLGLLLGLALAVDGPTLEAGLAAEARSRSLHPGGAPWQHTAGLAATPRLSLRLDGPDLRLGATYAPRLSAPDVLTTDRVDTMHELRLEARTRAWSGLELSAAVVGAAGTASLVQEARREDATAEPFTTTAVLRRRALSAALGATAQLDRRTSASAALGWSTSGGADAEARRLQPTEHALRLDAALRWRASRVDELGLALGATESRLATGSLAGFGLLSASWRHRPGPRLEAHAAAGAGASYTEEPTRPASLRPAFGGEAGLVHSLPAPALTQRLAVRATPSVDRQRGTIDPRLEAEASSALALPDAWRVALRGVGAVVRREPGDVRLLVLDLRVERALRRRLSAGLGGYAAWQRSAAPDLPSFFEAGGFVSLAWDSDRMELRP